MLFYFLLLLSYLEGVEITLLDINVIPSVSFLCKCEIVKTLVYLIILYSMFFLVFFITIIHMVIASSFSFGCHSMFLCILQNSLPMKESLKKLAAFNEFLPMRNSRSFCFPRDSSYVFRVLESLFRYVSYVNSNLSKD